MSFDDKVLPPHVSAVRAMVSEGRGTPFHPLKSLAEAKATADAVVIFEGDWGGQIYLTCPAWLVTADEDQLRELMIEIDRIGWREIDGAGIYYEVMPTGSGVAGGMGGAIVMNGLWLHPELETPAVRQMVEKALFGESQ